MFQPTVSVATALIAWAYGNERMTTLKFVSILWTTAGASVVAVEELDSDSGGLDFGDLHAIGMRRGLACLVVSVICTAMYFVLQKEMLVVYPPVFVTTVAYGVASVILL